MFRFNFFYVAVDVFFIGNAKTCVHKRMNFNFPPAVDRIWIAVKNTTTATKQEREKKFAVHLVTGTEHDKNVTHTKRENNQT